MASGTDDTTKTNEWHKHAPSTTCVSDEDCSSKYTCENGQCMPYQPDAKIATKEFHAEMKGMNSWQCNYVCSSDSDCNSLTGPCIYCSDKGDGSGGSCVSDEDDTGGTGLNGDDDTVFSALVTTVDQNKAAAVTLLDGQPRESPLPPGPARSFAAPARVRCASSSALRASLARPLKCSTLVGISIFG